VAGWYAYDADKVFLPKSGGTYITMGQAADDVTPSPTCRCAPR
jgi:hypothetical protein